MTFKCIKTYNTRVVVNFSTSIIRVECFPKMIEDTPSFSCIDYILLYYLFYTILDTRWTLLERDINADNRRCEQIKERIAVKVRISDI